MANHKSAQKRIRQSERRNVVNTNRKSKVRTCIKKVEIAISQGNQEVALANLRSAEKEMRKAVSKNVLKLKTVSRKVSRLSARVKAIGATEAA